MMDAAQFDYAPAVMMCFMHPRHAGSLKGEASTVSAQAGSRGQGASVRLWLRMTENKIAETSFQAYGCPHFIAAADMLCEWCRGRSLDELSDWSWRIVQDELAVPASKRGRLLLLENVLNDTINALRATQSLAG
ncbi:MAG: iron-sulfur cluster assembly scaffold protein [Steroidobacter sp.]